MPLCGPAGPGGQKLRLSCRGFDGSARTARRRREAAGPRKGGEWPCVSMCAASASCPGNKNEQKNPEAIKKDVLVPTKILT